MNLAINQDGTITKDGIIYDPRQPAKAESKPDLADGLIDAQADGFICLRNHPLGGSKFYVTEPQFAVDSIERLVRYAIREAAKRAGMMFDRLPQNPDTTRGGKHMIDLILSQIRSGQ